jgi:hypothetical protein
MADGSVAKDGNVYPETVRFRLIRADGRPSVKITTSEQGSGLTLGGGIDPTYIVLSADAEIRLSPRRWSVVGWSDPPLSKRRKWLVCYGL